MCLEPLSRASCIGILPNPSFSVTMTLQQQHSKDIRWMIIWFCNVSRTFVYSFTLWHFAKPFFLILQQVKTWNGWENSFEMCPEPLSRASLNGILPNPSFSVATTLQQKHSRDIKWMEKRLWNASRAFVHSATKWRFAKPLFLSFTAVKWMGKRFWNVSRAFVQSVT